MRRFCQLNSKLHLPQLVISLFDTATLQKIAAIAAVIPKMLYEKPLDPSKQEIRLLEIMTASSLEDPLQCKLLTVSLDCDQDYTALSYVWGDAADTVDIAVNGLRTPVTKNLESALRHLRQISKQSKDMDCSIQKLSTRLWVDAICINQRDDDEKSCQVHNMRDIYSKASLVVSWLGQDDDGRMSLAMKIIEIVARETSSGNGLLGDLEWLRQYPWLLTVDTNILNIPNASWDAINLLRYNPYWKRVWILQECAVARSLYIVSGLTVLDFACWVKFDVFQQSLASKDANDVLGSILKFYITQDHIVGSANIRLIDLLRRTLVSRTGFNFDIFLTTYKHLATDPRDKIFALQGVIGQAIALDYKASVHDIYSLFALKWLSSWEFDILRWSGISSWQNPTASPIALPSWIPNWQEISLFSFWRLPAYFGTKSSCSRRLENLCRLGPRITDKFYLEVDGSISDTILQIQCIGGRFGPIRFWKFCARYIKLSGSKNYPTGVTPFEASIRLFLADQSPWDKNKQLDLTSLQRAISSCGFIFRPTKSQESEDEESESTISEDDARLLRELRSEILADTNFNDTDGAESLTSDTLTVYAHLSHYMDNDCAVFRTVNGYLGMSSSKAQEGDKVCVLNTCPFPVVLRESYSHYIHVGACCVEGLMEAGAAQLVEDQRANIQEFQIR